jgi:NTP pyrophosphatase (non-canonical NTP hydrolase)
MVKWQRLIEERNTWVNHNFPGDESNSIFGVIEELGELTHHHLKEDQNIRGSADMHQEEARDAVGDLTIYMLGIMNVVGSPNQVHGPLHAFPDVEPGEALLNLAIAVGRLVERMSTTTVTMCVYHLKHYCVLREWDYEEIVEETWERVKQRDWIAYPDTGLPPEERGEDPEEMIEDDDGVERSAMDMTMCTCNHEKYHHWDSGQCKMKYCECQVFVERAAQ